MKIMSIFNLFEKKLEDLLLNMYNGQYEHPILTSYATFLGGGGGVRGRVHENIFEIT